MKVTLSSVTAVVEFSGQGSNIEFLHMILILISQRECFFGIDTSIYVKS